MTPTVDLFLAGAHAALRALDDPLVAERWDAPSVLEGQTVGSLAAHLARGGVWVVAEYLDAATTADDAPLDYEGAAEYYAAYVAAADASVHQAGRDRGAAVAATGHPAVRDKLAAQIAALETRLPALGPDARVTVIGGRVMRVTDYLDGRVVEQVVHADDLARSVGYADATPWGVPAEATRLVLAIGVDIGVRCAGATSMLRALYRDGQAHLPVI